jgi:hypothetical protein
LEGGLGIETTYDGRKLQWSRDAKRALWTMQDAYTRRRVKARVEKSARIKKLSTVTLDFARRLVEEETGVPLALPPDEDGGIDADAAGGGELKLRARDAQRNPLVSAFEWDAAAVERFFRIPMGFMRTRTQARIEALAVERGAGAIDLQLVEDGLAVGRLAMEEFIEAQAAESAGGNGARAAAQGNGGEAAPAAGPAASPGKCPWHNAAVDIVRNPEAAEAAKEGLYLNEVGLMSALHAKRKD